MPDMLLPIASPTLNSINNRASQRSRTRERGRAEVVTDDRKLDEALRDDGMTGCEVWGGLDERLESLPVGDDGRRLGVVFSVHVEVEFDDECAALLVLDREFSQLL